MEKYQNIINIDYPKSKNRKHMSLNDRAAQFAPFSALNGYEESIKEVSRITTPKKELTQENKDIISSKLNFITTNHLLENISITYFIKDARKTGGKYVTITDQIKRIDEVNKIVYFVNNQEVKIDSIIDVTSYTFDSIFIDF